MFEQCPCGLSASTVCVATVGLHYGPIEHFIYLSKEIVVGVEEGV